MHLVPHAEPSARRAEPVISPPSHVLNSTCPFFYSTAYEQQTAAIDFRSVYSFVNYISHAFKTEKSSRRATVAYSIMFMLKQILSRNQRTLFESINGRRSLVSSLSFEGIEKAAARHAANHFINTMDKNSKYIDIPTICVSDPANLTSWEWSANLDSKPKHTSEEIMKMSRSCSIDAFHLVEKDISTLSGMIFPTSFIGSMVIKERCTRET